MHVPGHGSVVHLPVKNGQHFAELGTVTDCLTGRQCVLLVAVSHELFVRHRNTTR